jgi:hypothetical protein
MRFELTRVSDFLVRSSCHHPKVKSKDRDGNDQSRDWTAKNEAK